MIPGPDEGRIPAGQVQAPGQMQAPGPLFSHPGGHDGTLHSNRPALLSLSGVQTLIGPYHILHGVDFQVPERGLTMLLGRNGAGKTTTLRTIMGLWKASQGTILYDGADITRRDTPDIALAGVGYVPESMGIFAGLTVRENLVLAARQGEIDDARLQWIFTLFPALERFWTLPAGHLSGGQKQMLATARAIIEPKKLLLVDEPTKGLAPAIINNMIDAFKELKATTTLLVVEQNFRFAQALGDTVAVMDSGRIVHQGTMTALAQDPALQQSLLGLDLGAHQ
jgi:branched-chain amino acid transport system ATP-binding protein